MSTTYICTYIWVTKMTVYFCCEEIFFFLHDWFANKHPCRNVLSIWTKIQDLHFLFIYMLCSWGSLVLTPAQQLLVSFPIASPVQYNCYETVDSCSHIYICLLPQGSFQDRETVVVSYTSCHNFIGNWILGKTHAMKHLWCVASPL